MSGICVHYTKKIWKEKHTDPFGGDKDFGVCFKLGFVWKDWTSWYWTQYTVRYTAKTVEWLNAKTRPKLMTHLGCNFWLIPSHTTTYHPIQSHAIPNICIWKMIINIAVSSTDAWHTEEPETICSHEPGSRANVRTGLTHTLGRLEIAGITGGEVNGRITPSPSPVPPLGANA